LCFKFISERKDINFYLAVKKYSKFADHLA